jgi:hypothetical protein
MVNLAFLPLLLLSMGEKEAQGCTGKVMLDIV